MSFEILKTQKKKMRVFIFSEVTVNGKISFGKNQNSKILMESFNDNDRKYIHNCRGKVDAIIIGRNTVTIDNPQLTNRFGNGKHPDRLVISNTLDFSLDEEIFDENAHTIVITSKINTKNAMVKKIEDLGHECIIVGETRVDFAELFDILAKEKKYETVMVEGGGIIISELLRDKLIDEMFVLRLPVIVCGEDVPEFAEYLGKEYCNQLKYLESLKYDNFVVERYVLTN